MTSCVYYNYSCKPQCKKISLSESQKTCLWCSVPYFLLCSSGQSSQSCSFLRGNAAVPGSKLFQTSCCLALHILLSTKVTETVWENLHILNGLLHVQCISKMMTLDCMLQTKFSDSRTGSRILNHYFLLNNHIFHFSI